MAADACIEATPLAYLKTAPRPQIDIYRAAGDFSCGVSVVIFPGGGYHHLAPHEGEGYARFLAQQGFTCFVTHYRLVPAGHRHPCMLEDAIAAMETARERAAEFGGNPACVGVMGSSAGGHLAAHLLTRHRDYPQATRARPDFGILCYPVISSDPAIAHEGSISGLLGEHATNPAARAGVSCDLQVNADTPPCFLWHTAEDAAVPAENSLRFAAALGRHKVPYELHVYPHGRHGLGITEDPPWPRACLRWLRQFSSL